MGCAVYRLGVLEHVLPLGMLAAFGVDVGAKRDDREILRACIIDEPLHQGPADPQAAHGIGDGGVVGDDQPGVNPAVGELALAVDARHRSDVAALAGMVLSRDGHIGHGTPYHLSTDITATAGGVSSRANKAAIFAGSTLPSVMVASLWMPDVIKTPSTPGP